MAEEGHDLVILIVVLFRESVAITAPWPASRRRLVVGEDVAWEFVLVECRDDIDLGVLDTLQSVIHSF